MHPHPHFCWGEGGGVELLTKFSKKGEGDLIGSRFLEGVAGKEGMNNFREVAGCLGWEGVMKKQYIGGIIKVLRLAEFTFMISLSKI